MAAFNVHEAKTNFSKLLDRVLEGEEVLITRNGVPVAELVPARRRPFPLGAGRNDPDINPAVLASDDWWRPMTDDEVEAFLDGRY
jgi:prevent-host-death family protein